MLDLQSAGMVFLAVGWLGMVLRVASHGHWRERERWLTALASASLACVGAVVYAAGEFAEGYTVGFAAAAAVATSAALLFLHLAYGASSCEEEDESGEGEVQNRNEQAAV